MPHTQLSFFMRGRQPQSWNSETGPCVSVTGRIQAGPTGRIKFKGGQKWLQKGRFGVNRERDVIITEAAHKRSSLLGEAVAAITQRVQKMAAQPPIMEVGDLSISCISSPQALRHLEIVL